MSVVSNTGPLIALAKVDQLALLQALFDQVKIGPVVQRELLAKAGEEAEHLDAALSTFVAVVDPFTVPPDVRLAASTLDAGEREAVALARLEGLPLVIDDRLGRQVARRLGIRVTGTGGVLVAAKQKGLVSAVRPLVDQIRRNGYWLSDEVVGLVSRLAGE